MDNVTSSASNQHWNIAIEIEMSFILVNIANRNI